jgi:hypothetical protein
MSLSLLTTPSVSHARPEPVVKEVHKAKRRYFKKVVSCPVSGYLLTPLVDTFLEGACWLATGPPTSPAVAPCSPLPLLPRMPLPHLAPCFFHGFRVGRYGGGGCADTWARTEGWIDALMHSDCTCYLPRAPRTHRYR